MANNEGANEETSSQADPFAAYRVEGKKHRGAVLALALARSLKYSGRGSVFAKARRKPTSTSVGSGRPPPKTSLTASASIDSMR